MWEAGGGEGYLMSLFLLMPSQHANRPFLLARSVVGGETKERRAISLRIGRCIGSERERASERARLFSPLSPLRKCALPFTGCQGRRYSGILRGHGSFSSVRQKESESDPGTFEHNRERTRCFWGENSPCAVSKPQ